MYRTVKRLGIPDSNIILMLADDVSYLYGDNVEVDYRGYEVTVENFIRMLTGRVSPDTPRSKRLLSDDRSNIFVYMTGHGGDEFLKFQDAEEVSAYDLADAFKQMYEKKRYNEIFFMIDTCQANTMYEKIDSPNILATGSSKLGESSYSHHIDYDIGVAVIDSFTYYNLDFLEKIDMTSNATLNDLFQTYDPVKIASHPGIRSDLFRRPLDKVKVTDFFGNVQNVELTRQRYPLVEVNNGGKNIIEEYQTINQTKSDQIDNANSITYHSFQVLHQKPKITNTISILGFLFTIIIGYFILISMKF
ncbi:unnamed protein product [Cunninghamella blakesleeana]